MFVFDLDDLIWLHDQILEASGGLAGVKDPGQLEAALARPNQSAFKKSLFPDLFEKAAALLEAIANNHAFSDGNKRTAMAAAALFLYLDGVLVTFTNQEYESFMLHVVNDKPELSEIQQWLKAHGKNDA